MDKKPKIAFCFSGQARTLDETYVFFQKNLFDAAEEQGFDYDVFCAVEDDEDVYKVKLLNPTKVEKIKSCNVEKIIEKKYDEQFNNSEQLNKNCYFFDKKYYLGRGDKNKIYNFFQQIYKVSESMLLCREYIKKNNLKYNIVFRLRFDTFFLNKLDFEKINNYLHKNNIICNKRKFLHTVRYFYKIEDLFFIGNEKIIDILGNFFNDFFGCLKGDEIKSVFIFKIFKKIESFILKVNDLLGHWILPIYPLYYIESLFYKRFTPEICYYNYFIKNKSFIKIHEFSHILLRNEWNISYIKIEKQKNIFEK